MLSFDQLIERNHRLIALAATVRARCWDAAATAAANLQVMQRHASVMHALAAEQQHRRIELATLPRWRTVRMRP
jgi:hypothetical protein